MFNTAKRYGFRQSLFPIAIFFFFIFINSVNSSDFFESFGTSTFNYSSFTLKSGCDSAERLNNSCLPVNYTTAFDNQWYLFKEGAITGSFLDNALSSQYKTSSGTHWFLKRISGSGSQILYKDFPSKYNLNNNSNISFRLNFSQSAGGVANFYIRFDTEINNNGGLILSFSPDGAGCGRLSSSQGTSRCCSYTQKNVIKDWNFNIKDSCSAFNESSKVNLDSLEIYFYDTTDASYMDMWFDDLRISNFSSIANNNLPSIQINNLESVYCYNTSSNVYVFNLTAADTEGDTIYYYDYWDNDFEQEVMIDTFTDPDYSMSNNGWAFDSVGCNYSTSEGYLQLFNGCDNVWMAKWLDNSELSGEDLKVSFNAWVFLNTSAEYDIYNWHNEHIGGIKLASYYDFEHEIYTNLSYWNGSTYLNFNQSYYWGIFGFDFYFNETHLRICSSGLDENLGSTEDCKYEIVEELHGTTDNIPAKFTLYPKYNFMWEAYEPSYVILDELSYQWTEIDWLTYNEGDSLSKIINEQGEYTLNILVTDDINTPDYMKYSYPITVFGDCANKVFYNETEGNISGFSDIGDYFINSINNGKAIFNSLFYIVLLIFLIYLLVGGMNFEFSVIVVGITGLVISFFLAGDITMYVSSASLLALGLALILSRLFL